MSGIDTTNSAGTYGYTAQSVKTESTGTGMDLGTDTFLKLLVAQMRHQDPFSGGQDMGDFMSQVAQFTMLERIIKLQTTLEDFAAQQAPTRALSLLNRTVEVKGPEGHILSGEVTAVRFQDGEPLLKIGGTEYPLSSVVRVEGSSAEEGTEGTAP